MAFSWVTEESHPLLSTPVAVALGKTLNDSRPQLLLDSSFGQGEQVGSRSPGSREMGANGGGEFITCLLKSCCLLFSVMLRSRAIVQDRPSFLPHIYGDLEKGGE